ncbi:hypothetical protein DPEC_G00182930 [Dallia pectoralis]|uniref:Uncharacterized protein n=1 Tax=Dallia pectoralis TaxID=75939 RepID=A0ACC2GAR5_DALPE|nr:hypothetical protein DPEC_G00182930 [Dallia pectoralis]
MHSSTLTRVTFSCQARGPVSPPVHLPPGSTSTCGRLPRRLSGETGSVTGTTGRHGARCPDMASRHVTAVPQSQRRPTTVTAP